MSAGTRWRIAVYTPLPEKELMDNVHVNAARTSIQFSQELPGGYSSFEIGLAIDEDGQYNSYLPRDVYVRHWSHCEIYYEGILIFEGRVTLRKRVNGQLLGFGGIGYGFCATNQMVYRSISAVSTDTLTILNDVLSSCAPLLQIDSNRDYYKSTFVSHTPAEFNRMYPSEILKRFMEEGGVDNTTGLAIKWDYLVTLGRYVRFWPRIKPEFADYIIPIDDRLEIVEDSSAVVGAASVVYTKDTVEYETDISAAIAYFEETYGVLVHGVYDGGELTDASAIAFRDRYVSTNSQLGISATFSRNINEYLSGKGSAPHDALLARVGQWAEISGYDMYPIVGIDCDAETISFTLGEQSPYDRVQGVLNRLHIMQIELSDLKAGKHPRTGAKLARISS